MILKKAIVVLTFTLAKIGHADQARSSKIQWRVDVTAINAGTNETYKGERLNKIFNKQIPLAGGEVTCLFGFSSQKVADPAEGENAKAKYVQEFVDLVCEVGGYQVASTGVRCGDAPHELGEGTNRLVIGPSGASPKKSKLPVVIEVACSRSNGKSLLKDWTASD